MSFRSFRVTPADVDPKSWAERGLPYFYRAPSRAVEEEIVPLIAAYNLGNRVIVVAKLLTEWATDAYVKANAWDTTADRYLGVMNGVREETVTFG